MFKFGSWLVYDGLGCVEVILIRSRLRPDVYAEWSETVNLEFIVCVLCDHDSDAHVSVHVDVLSLVCGSLVTVPSGTDWSTASTLTDSPRMEGCLHRLDE